MLDLSRFTPEQREVILAEDGPLLVFAGPGSGKTMVLAARVVHLVAARGVSSASILAMAFANRAARELRARLGALLGDQARGIDVSTFHAFGLRIARQWSDELGYGVGPLAVYDADDAAAVLKGVADDLSLDLKERPLADLARELELYRLGGTVPSMRKDTLAALAEAYEEVLLRKGAVDFASMLALPLRLFDSRPDALRFYQDSYRYLLVDEVQDLCDAQYTLLVHLARHHQNLLAVGDPRQGLYGWRGARARSIAEFQRDFPGARLFQLGQDFRSTGNLVALANVLGASLPGAQRLWTDNPPGELARLYAASNEWQEAEFVADRVLRLMADGAISRFEDVAVLYRTNQQSHQVAAALRTRAVPYRVRGSGDLFRTREVRDAVAYLRLISNPGDGVALARIVNAPPRRLGRLAEGLEKDPVGTEDLPGAAAPFGPTALASAEGLRDLVQGLHAIHDQLSPADALQLVLDRSGYRAWAESRSDASVRLAHLHAFQVLAGQAEGSLEDGLAELQLGEELEAGQDGVLLSTVHGAKGSEWAVVFAIGLEEGLLPHARALTAADAPGSGPWRTS